VCLRWKPSFNFQLFEQDRKRVAQLQRLRSETRSKRAIAKRAIPRANALLSLSVSLSRGGSAPNGFRCRRTVTLRPPGVGGQRGECFSRSSGPKTNYPPSWRLSGKYWKAPPSRRVGLHSFPARRFMRAGLSRRDF